MKDLFYNTLNLWLLALLLALPVLGRAQGMELFSITQSDKATLAKEAMPPPKVNVLNISDQVERNYNLIPATVALRDTATDLSQLMVQIQRLETDIASRAAERDKLDSKSAGYKEAQETINKLTETKKSLLAYYTQKAKDNTTAWQMQARAQQELQRRLSTVYEKQLSTLRTEVTTNSVVQRQTLDAYGTEIKKLRQYQTDYWNKMPDIATKEDIHTSDKAFREFDHKLLTLEQQLRQANTAYSDFQTAAKSLESYKLDLSDPQGNGELQYNQQQVSIQTATTTLITKVDTVRNSLDAYNKQVDKWQADFKAALDKKTGTDNNLTALPALTGIKGTGVYIPAVSLIGSHRGGDVNSPNIYSIKLFTALGGPEKANDIPSKRGTERLFIPDASTFGFSADGVFSMKYADRQKPVMGVTMGAAYLDKLMTPDSLTTFTSGVLTARVGLEWYLIPDVLLLYGGVNSLSFLTSRDEMDKHYTLARPKDLYFFTNGGVRAILKPSTDTGLSFLFDLGFVYKGEDVRRFVPNNDFTIMTLRATLAKNFALR